MIQKLLLRGILFLIVSLNVFQFATAQNSSSEKLIYKLSFEDMDQQKVKPLISHLMPIFNQVPFIQQDEYGSFYYEIKGEIDEESLRLNLDSYSVKLIDIDLIDRELYDEIIKSSVNPKN